MMDDLKNAVVMPNFPGIGIGSKESRGVIAEEANVPSGLSSVQSALQTIASRMGVDLTQTGNSLRQSFEAALIAKVLPTAASVSAAPPDKSDPVVFLQ
jgi:precorrin-6B methylase 1